MHFKHLTLVNFKNYESLHLTFLEHVNCLVGNNGVGKTNILDAIHYMTFCKSFLNATDAQNINHQSEMFVIQAEISENQDSTSELYCGVKKGNKKQFKRNKKEYTRLADHIGRYPLVLIAPSDIFLIYEGSDERRKFIDSVIAQFDNTYLNDLLTYNRTLQQRNTLLKKFAEQHTFDKTLLEIFDEVLINKGNAIFNKRKLFLTNFIPIFKHTYLSITNNLNEEIDIDYQSQLSENNFSTLLNDNLKKDIALQYTSVGIHKDDLLFSLNQMPLKKIASQGQQKSFLIALKLAEHKFLKLQKGIAPILLIDDIFDKLDTNRVQALVQLLDSNDFNQIFITDTDRKRMTNALNLLKNKHHQIIDLPLL